MEQLARFPSMALTFIKKGKFITHISRGVKQRRTAPLGWSATFRLLTPPIRSCYTKAGFKVGNDMHKSVGTKKFF
jgi:hypothetical protein